MGFQGRAGTVPESSLQPSEFRTATSARHRSSSKCRRRWAGWEGRGDLLERAAIVKPSTMLLPRITFVPSAINR